ncbi:4-hydroxy-tetrahydrodipicolinate reductase [Neisseria sp. Ec49-e6-T10]|uniref:4-hydroxy-tetrahydrodipicolinate reductase n=1 Tax=Neisseria sp. Ec49-e6-T10 TaxID=3140744 RepID=UPI003EB9BFDA
MSTLKVAIVGASGRMGRTLIEATQAHPSCQLTHAIDQPDSPYIGQDAGLFIGKPTNVNIQTDIEQAIKEANVLIDFTRPQGTLEHLALCTQYQTNIIIGTTGFDEAGKQAIQNAGQTIGVVFAPNFSIGVNLSFALLDIAAKVLQPDYDIEIIEAHHRHKIDAPSGTALRMGEVIAQATNRNLKQCAIYGREGVTGERDPNTIGFSTIRAGDVVGDHTALFATDGERFEITHKASSRMTFASGAVRAALWLGTQKGVFDMQDVLGLKNLG